MTVDKGTVILIEHGIHQGKNKEKTKLLNQAITSDKQQDTIALIKHLASREVVVFPQGKTILHIAAQKGFKELVTYLLEKGYDSMAQDSSGKLPEEYATQNSHQEVATILSKHREENNFCKICTETYEKDGRKRCVRPCSGAPLNHHLCKSCYVTIYNKARPITLDNKAQCPQCKGSLSLLQDVQELVGSNGFCKFKEAAPAPLKDYLYKQVSDPLFVDDITKVVSFGTILAILQVVINNNGLYDPHNPAIILADAELENIFDQKAFHMEKICELVANQLIGGQEVLKDRKKKEINTLQGRR